jgi:hypothetical protein
MEPSRDFMLRTLLPLLAGLVAVACDDDQGSHARCDNGTCTCAALGECELECAAPPCHVLCEEGSQCDAACANGECACEERASCAFRCDAPPCHVRCEGENPSCAGTCANGTCECGPDSQCEFTCGSGPCHTLCGAGSSCVVHCPQGTPGSQNCDITQCASGEVTLCPDGRATTCNAPCPDQT